MQNANGFQAWEGFVQNVTTQQAGPKMMPTFTCMWSNIGNQHRDLQNLNAENGHYFSVKKQKNGKHCFHF